MQKSYLRLGVMAALSFVSMYVLMYAMVDSFANVIPNINQFYMALLMTVPMIVIEVFLMSHMYQNRLLNVGIVVASLFVLFGSFFLIRAQVGVGDTQFLKSMIPHHAGAVLMCSRANVKDAQIQELCRNILKGQQAEIEWMKSKLESLK